MGFHNDTCGCAECGNYGQVYNPRAIHNQSCGCAECGNYGPTCAPVKKTERTKVAVPEVVMVAVPVDLVEEVNALIVRRRKS